MNKSETVQVIGRAPPVTMTFLELVDFFLKLPGQRRFIMLAGPQGSGKSYLAKALWRLKDGDFHLFKRLSTDKISKRSPWLGEEEVLSLYEEELKAALQAGRNIIDDNLNACAKVRAKALGLARKYGYDHIYLVYIELTLEQCLEHNAMRKRQTPEWIVRAVWDKFYKSGLPTAQEGAVIKITPTALDQSYEVSFSAHEPGFAEEKSEKQSSWLSWFRWLLFWK
jgi:predicted kinase